MELTDVIRPDSGSREDFDGYRASAPSRVQFGRGQAAWDYWYSTSDSGIDDVKVG